MKTRSLGKLSAAGVIPIRLLHASLLGMALGFVLSLTIHFAGLHLHNNSSAAANTTGDSPGPARTPSTPSTTTAPRAFLGTPTPDDSDGDGIPNDWEISLYHNPNDAADASADFDNDGLTALQEYQLHTRSGGTAGNPLGNWRVRTLVPPDDLKDLWFWPVAINNHDDVLVQAYGGTPYRYVAFLISQVGTWTEIASSDKPSWYSFCSDLNDLQQVVGERYSEDGSASESFVWDPLGGFKPLQYQGKKAVAYKINNHGDWMGAVIEPLTGEYKQAWIVGGQNQVGSQDWWPYSWFTDLNDAGEAMGSYCNPLTGQTQTFLAYGSWRYETDFAGSQPMFDASSYVWSWASAMNGQGEFTGSGGGKVGHEWDYLAYHFDGAFTPLRFNAQSMSYIYSESLNSSNTIVGYADNYPADYGGFIFRDGIGLFLHQLHLDIPPCYSAQINNAGTILTTSQATGEISLIFPDQDADADGMSDDWEAFHNLNPNDASDAFADSDADGIGNLGEFMLRSDPNVFTPRGSNGQPMDTRPGIDSDGDGIPNTWEWQNGLDFEDPGDAPLDPDRDGFTNLQEYQLNTDPRGSPHYRIREIGPFPGTSTVNLSSTTLGRGQGGGQPNSQAGATLTESATVYACPSDTPTQGNSRPAVWSIQRSQDQGAFALYPSHGSPYLTPIATADTGAALARHSSNPFTLVYWASPTATPVSISGAVPSASNTTACNIRSLSSAKLSPSGTWLVGWRDTMTGYSHPMLMKMPVGNQIFAPVPLVPPTGLILPKYAPLQVNDAGYVIATAMQGGNKCGVLWKYRSSNPPEPRMLPPHPGGTWSSVSGLSNTADPIVAGSATLANRQRRATVWNSSGTPVDLGTLDSGNDSFATAISPSGLVAGISNVLEGATYRSQSFIAKPAKTGSSMPWKIFAQGASACSITHAMLTDSGELLGDAAAASSQPYVPTLWRSGRAHPLDAVLPATSGYNLISILAINPNGTLLVSAWKSGYQARLLLTPDADTDGDGLPDVYENINHFNPYAAQVAATDTDGDGLSDLLEYRNGCNPRLRDSDGDGMNDAWEIQWGFNPLNPADAASDADGDGVSNQRESELGTNPVGVYRTQVLYTGAPNSYSYPCAYDDTGRVIITQSQYSSGTMSDGRSYSTSTDTTNLINPNSTQLISRLSVTSNYYSEYDPSNGRYVSTSQFLSFNLDAISGAVHGQVDHYGCSYEGMNYQYDESRSFIPDVMAADAGDSASWISWETVCANIDGDFETLYSYPALTTSDYSRGIYQDDWGNNHLLDACGQAVLSGCPPSMLPDSTWIEWQQMNSSGHALTLRSRYIAATNGVPAHYRYEIIYWDGTNIVIIPTPEAWNVAGPNSSIYLHSISDDGLALMQYSYRNPDGNSTSEYHLLNLANQTFTRVTTPGMGYEYITGLSPRNGRMIGTANKPFLVTAGGTCLRMDALHIRNSITSPGQSLTSLFPRGVYPLHITSDGRITFSTNDANNCQVIAQIIPANDLNGNGIPDDWERSEIAYLIAKDPARWGYLAATGTLDVNMDYWANSWSAAQSFALRLSNGDTQLSNTNNADGDAAVDGDDADPFDTVVDWKPAAEAFYAVFDLGQENYLNLPNMEPGTSGCSITASIGNNDAVLWNDKIPTSVPGTWQDRSRVWKNGGWSKDLRMSPTTFGSCQLQSATGIVSVTPNQSSASEPVEAYPHAVCGDYVIGCGNYTGNMANVFPVATLWQSLISTQEPNSLVWESKPVAPPPMDVSMYARPYAGDGDWISKGYRAIASPGGAIAVLGGELPLSTQRLWKIWSPSYMADPTKYVPGTGNRMWLMPYLNDSRRLHITAIEDGGTVAAQSYSGPYLFDRRLVVIERTREAVLPQSSGWVPEVNSVCRVCNTVPDRSRLVAAGTKLWVNSDGIWNVAKPTIYPVLAVADNGVLLGPRSIWRNGKEISLDKLVEKIQEGTSPRYTNVRAYAMNGQGAIVALAKDIRYPVAGKYTQLVLMPLEVVVAVDANRDGQITFDGKDETSADLTYRFWQNDNQDEPEESSAYGDFLPETIPPNKKDSNDTVINSTRDLQDFARLKLLASLYQSKLTSDEIRIGFKWNNLKPAGSSVGLPAIRLFQVVGNDDSDKYLKDPIIANKQFYECRQALVGANGENILCANRVYKEPDYVITNSTWIQTRDENNRIHLNLLFEGVDEGIGKLTVVALNRKNQLLGEGPSIWLEIKNVEHMYMSAHATPTITNYSDPYNIFKDLSPEPSDPYKYIYVTNGTNIGPVAPRGQYGVDVEEKSINWLFGYDEGQPYTNFESLADEEKKCIVFVHGVNMRVVDTKAYAAAFYKRLWWEGYRGRLTVFRWPTKIASGLGPDALYTDIFNTSEFRAWTSGIALKKYVGWLRSTLGSDWKFGLAAHSLGNVCACSALHHGMVVDNYVMLEAALSTSSLYAPATSGTSDPLAGHFHPSLANANGTDVGKQTPYDFNDLGYRGYLKDIKQNVKGKITNYHNDNDFWLATGTLSHSFPRLDDFHVDWITNQAAYKPNGVKSYSFYPIHELKSGGQVYGRPVVSAYESMSFISRSRTRPLGSEPPASAGGIPVPPFKITVDDNKCGALDLKNNYNYTNARSNHSGQFFREIYALYTNANMRPATLYKVAFYKQLMTDLGVRPQN